jgi:hypothetical protein
VRERKRERFCAERREERWGRGRGVVEGVERGKEEKLGLGV